MLQSKKSLHVINITTEKAWLLHPPVKPVSSNMQVKEKNFTAVSAYGHLVGLKTTLRLNKRFC